MTKPLQAQLDELKKDIEILKHANGVAISTQPEDASPEEMNWDDAVKWCADKGGRLPTRLELLDLYDNHREECITLIKDDSSNTFWSSTEYSASVAWYVYLNFGLTSSNNKSSFSNQVRCVR